MLVSLGIFVFMSAILGLFVMMCLGLNCDKFCFILAKVLFTAVILPTIFHDLTRLSF
jgi:hypothetical protein